MARPTEPSDGGTIVTFYSYKGGTGRSMALANVAWILASAGLRVLTLDWDLEAPGLHRFFAPFLDDRRLLESEGVIDWVLNFAIEADTPTGSEREGRSVPVATPSSSGQGVAFEEEPRQPPPVRS